MAAVAARPATESMLTAAGMRFRRWPGRSTPTRRSRWLASNATTRPCARAIRFKYEKLEQALARRSASAPAARRKRVQARLVAMIATGAMRVGQEV